MSDDTKAGDVEQADEEASGMATPSLAHLRAAAVERLNNRTDEERQRDEAAQAAVIAKSAKLMARYAQRIQGFNVDPLSSYRGVLQGSSFAAITHASDIIKRASEPTTALAERIQNINGDYTALRQAVTSAALVQTEALTANRQALEQAARLANGSYLADITKQLRHFNTDLNVNIAAIRKLQPDYGRILEAARHTNAINNAFFARHKFSLQPFADDFYRTVRERFWPRNLRNRGHDLEAVNNLMRDDGIPLCLVPDPDTVKLLLDASDRPTRRRILAQRAEDIFGSCEPILSLCVRPDLGFHGSLIRQAIASHHAGFTAASQALATVVLDALTGLARDRLIARGLANNHQHARKITSDIDGHHFIAKRVEPGHYIDAFFLAPLPVVNTRTDRVSDPDAYNRNSTVHKSSDIQFSPANSVQAVMLATSFLGYQQGLW